MNRLVLTALLSLTAALAPEVQAALESASSRYAEGAAHAAAFTHLYTPAGFATPKREAGVIWIQRPQRLRFDYTTPEKKTVTYDSGEGRLYAPEDKQLTIQKLPAEDRARLPILFLTDPAGLSREYEVSVEATTPSGTRLLLKPRRPRPELAWLRVTIAKDGAVPELSYEDSSGNRTEFRFEGWRREKPRPETDYRVTGPPGTQVLEN